MQLSAEIRWFWKDAPPDGLQPWFPAEEHHPCPAGGGLPRVDRYLSDPVQAELAIKRRGASSAYEAKGLVSVGAAPLQSGTFAGRIEIWCKWSSESLRLDDSLLISIEKTRWLRKFDTAADPVEIPLNEKEQPIDERRRGAGLPQSGCHVELTHVRTGQGTVWWTFGLEAFGTLQTVDKDLRAVAGEMNARRLRPLARGLELSYPAWLRDYGSS
jgi:hypothetical protein